ncbi:hypothetical protein [Candidatus Cryosericum septentrionale]|nr:hypothetical protein [Candidatus Cryosericum septentrionale]
MAGIAVMFVVFGMLGTVTAAAGFFIHQLRDAEELLPDVVAPDAACEIAH